MKNTAKNNSPKSDAISFRHPYYKLERARAGEVFTTIRGKAQFKRRTVGQRVLVEAPAGDFTAVITALELKRVDAMTVDFLRADAEYPGCTITTHQQFMNLLNSFRAPLWAKVTTESELTIITLKMLPATSEVSNRRDATVNSENGHQLEAGTLKKVDSSA